jgi:hypothetical protein
MLVHESLLQVTLFETLQSNLSLLDFSLLLPDVMTMADEVDAQLTRSMDSYMIVIQSQPIHNSTPGLTLAERFRYCSCADVCAWGGASY